MTATKSLLFRLALALLLATGVLVAGDQDLPSEVVIAGFKHGPAVTFEYRFTPGSEGRATVILAEGGKEVGRKSVALNGALDDSLRVLTSQLGRHANETVASAKRLIVTIRYPDRQHLVEVSYSDAPDSSWAALSSFLKACAKYEPFADAPME